MKHLNLFAWGEISLEDLRAFLAWLDAIPSGEASIEQIKKNPPIRTSKVGAVLRVLEGPGFVRVKAGHYVLTPSGEEFAKSSPSGMKASIRGFFLAIEPIRRIAELLGASLNGRLPKLLVGEMLSKDSPTAVTEAEVQGLILWAGICGLFGYDRRRQEIVRLENESPETPFGRTPSPGPNIAELPRAS